MTKTNNLIFISGGFETIESWEDNGIMTTEEATKTLEHINKNIIKAEIAVECATTETDALECNYYNIEFEDGFEIEAISGHHLDGDLSYIK